MIKNKLKKIRVVIGNQKGDSTVYILLAVVCAMFLAILVLAFFILWTSGSDIKDKISQKAKTYIQHETTEYTTEDPVVSYDTGVTEAQTQAVEEATEATEAQTQTDESLHGSISLDNSGAGSGNVQSNQNTSQDYMQSVLTDLVYNYGNSLCTAINVGDYGIVSPYIQSGSALETMQRSLVSNLYSKGTTESFEWATVKSFVVDNSGLNCTLYVDECEKINSYSKGTYTKTFSWTYTAHCENGVWRLSNLQ